MLILVQNDETRSKLDKIRAGPTQIDPRGSNGPLKSDSRSIYAGQVLKNPGWLSGDPRDIPKVAACVHFVRPRAIPRACSLSCLQRNFLAALYVATQRLRCNAQRKAQRKQNLNIFFD